MLDKSKSAKKAAVLALFYPNRSYETSLVLILRNSYPGVHSAQVAFPGGKIEPQDLSIEAAAIRETEEEIGVDSKDIQLVKAMSPLYIPPSNFIVYPFLGTANEPLQFIKEESEVQEIIEVKLSDFLDARSVVRTRVSTSYKIEVEVPAFSLNGYTVWGATAMMLSEIKQVLNQMI